MQIDISTLTPEQSYRLITGAVVPRPIAWVSTLNENGTTNLAPFSAFNFVCSFPLMLGFNVGRRLGAEKDTARNIRRHPEYVVHIADEAMVEKLHLSSFEHEPEVSEAEVLGLETTPANSIRGSRLLAAPIAMECRLSQILNFGTTGADFMVGEVVRVHLRDGLYKDGKIDSAELRPLCRIAGPNYAGLGQVYAMKPLSNLPGGG